MDLLIETVRASRMLEPLARPQRPIFRPSQTRVLVLGANHEAAKPPFIFATAGTSGATSSVSYRATTAGGCDLASNKASRLTRAWTTCLTITPLTKFFRSRLRRCRQLRAVLQMRCARHNVEDSDAVAVGCRRSLYDQARRKRRIPTVVRDRACGRNRLGIKRLIDVAAAVVGLFVCASRGCYRPADQKETGGSAIFRRCVSGAMVGLHAIQVPHDAHFG